MSTEFVPRKIDTWDIVDAEAEGLDQDLRNNARNRVCFFSMSAVALRHLIYATRYRAIAKVSVEGSAHTVDITEAMIGCLEKFAENALQEMCEYGDEKEARQLSATIANHNQGLNGEWSEA